MCALLRRIVAVSICICAIPKARAQNEAAQSHSNSSCTAPVAREVKLGLHIAAIFVVLATSSAGITLPLLASKISGKGRIDEIRFIIKYFGTGIIVATAFVHLIYEGISELESPCINLSYAPTGPAIIMVGMFLVFFVDMIVMRVLRRRTTDRLRAQEANIQTNSENTCSPINNPGAGSESQIVPPARTSSSSSAASSQENNAIESEMDRQPETRIRLQTPNEKNSNTLMESKDSMPRAPSIPEFTVEEKQRQAFIDVCVLEGGIVFHSVMVGLGLGTTDGAKIIPLMIAIAFHQFCDGLAIGTRIGVLTFSKRQWWRPWVMCAVYSVITPIGIAIGTGVQSSFNPNEPAVIIAIGVLDCLSAGVLLWGALYDLLGRDFCSPSGELAQMSDTKAAIATVSMLSGAGIMSLIGKWA